MELKTGGKLNFNMKYAAFFRQLSMFDRLSLMKKIERVIDVNKFNFIYF